MKIKIFILFIFLALNNFSFAQCDQAILKDADKNYILGNFEDVITSMKKCITSKTKAKNKVPAYKMLAKTYLAIDSVKQAQNYIIDLLNIIPEYNNYTVNDPQFFIDLIELTKEQEKSESVFSASKMKESIEETPVTIMVLKREDIINRGYIDLEAILSDLPGFDISRTFGATYSNFYQRGYRANNTERTIILIDGVEDNDLWADFAYFGKQYPISNIERIEVVYGPASTIYGANAFLGVINIITKNNNDFINNEYFGITGQLNYGNWNTMYADITAAGKFKNTNLSVTVRRYVSDEMDLSVFPDYDYSPELYDNIDYKSILGINTSSEYVTNNNLVNNHSYYNLNYYANNDSVEIGITDAGANAAKNYDQQALDDIVNGNPVRYKNLADDWFINAKANFKNITVGFNMWKYVASGTTYFTDNYQAGGDNGSLWSPIHINFYTNFHHEITDVLIFSNSTHYKIHKVDDLTASVTFNNYSNGRKGFLNLIEDEPSNWSTVYLAQTSKQLRNESKIMFLPSANFRLIGGAEIRNGQLQGNYNLGATEYPTDSAFVGGSSTTQGSLYGGNSYDNRSIGAYLQGTFSPNDFLSITLGGRYDYNKIRNLGGYGSIFNPRVSLVFHPEMFVIKLIYSEAFKDASNWTKFTTNPQRLVTSPNIKPERVKNYEINFMHKFKELTFFELSAYYADYSGVIGTKTITMEDGTTTSKNFALGALKIYGIQSQLKASYRNFTSYINYTFTNPQSNIIEDEKLTGKFERLGDIASHRINFGINGYFWNRLNVNLRMNYVGERLTGPTTTVPSNNESFPEIIILNGALTYSFKFNAIEGFKKHRDKIKLQLVCNNILNLEYFDPGIRTADGTVYASRVPQRERHFMAKLLFNF